MRVVTVVSLAVLWSLGCGQGVPSDDGVSSRQGAVTAPGRIVLTPWTADAAAALPAATHGPAVPGVPTPPDYLARQQKYLEELQVKEQEWRAHGHSEAEQTRLQGELKRSMLGE